MSENDMIAEYVKEKYPELLEIPDFAMFKLRKVLEESAKQFDENFKKIDFSELIKAAAKIKNPLAEEKTMKNNFYNPEQWRSTSLWYRFIHEVHPAKTAERTQDGLNTNIVICDDLEHAKNHRFFQKVFGARKCPRCRKEKK